MDIKKIIIAAASALGVLASFMPWASVEATVNFLGVSQSAGRSVKGIEGDGIFTLFIFSIPLIISLIRLFVKKSDDPPRKEQIGIAAAGALGALIAVIEIGSVKSKFDSLDFGALSSYVEAKYTIEIGLWLILLMGIAVAVTPFLKIGQSAPEYPVFPQDPQ